MSSSSFVHVAPFPQKGQGYAATQSISPGLLLFEDDAIFSVGFSRGTKPTKTAMTELVKKFIHSQGNQPSSLTSTDLLIPLLLDSQQEGISDQQWTSAYFQVKNNSFVTQDPLNQEQEVLSFFPKVAYFNHSCSPSATIEQVPTKDGLKAFVVATGAVAEGQEITICYRPDLLWLPKARRQQLLKDNWGFTCACEKCQLPEDEPFLVQMTGFTPGKQAEVNAMYDKLEELYHSTWDLETTQKIKTLCFHFLRVLGTFHWQAVMVRRFLVEVLLTIAEYQDAQEEKEKAQKQLLQIIEQLFKCNQKILPKFSGSKMTLLNTYLQAGGTIEAAAKLDPDLKRVHEIFSPYHKS